MTSDQVIAGEEAAREYIAHWADKIAAERLELFCELLIAENQHQNLISKPSESQIWQRHLADSAQLLRLVSRGTEELGGPWLDLGTGAGFPGLVIAAIRPEWSVVLVESRAKRAEFLNRCAKALDLPNCEVIGERLERVQPFEARVISARAFAPLKKLLRLSAPFSTKATTYLLPKGRSAAHELAELKPSIRKLFHVEQSVTDSEAGIIVSAKTR